MQAKLFHLTVFGAMLLILFAIIDARPQQFSRPSWNQNPNNGNFGTTTTTSSTPRTGATAPTTASPAFIACLQRCQSTMEYNPVCGTDDISYHNEGRLRCALMCGKNVATVRQGTCNPL